MNGLAICAGAGGLELALDLVFGAAYAPVCCVEREAFVAAHLVARMDEGVLRAAPVWDDLATFDGRPWRGVVDIVTAGFPCQPFSVAGSQLGLEDERWLWPDIARILREVFGEADERSGGPYVIFLENVPPVIVHGLGDILRTLAELGFDAEWGCVSAADVGGSHGRERFYLLAVADAERHERGTGTGRQTQSRSQYARPAMADSRRTERRGASNAHDVAGQWAPDHDSRAGGELRQAVADAVRVRAPARDAAQARGQGERSESAVALDQGDDLADTEHQGFSIGGAAYDDDRRDAPGDDLDGCVPLFPPGPDRIDTWRAILAVRPDLAPAIGGYLVDATNGLQHPEPEESAASSGGRSQFEAGAGAAGGGLDLVEGEAAAESDVRGMADGVAPRVDRLRACGNGVVPLAAAYAFCALADRLGIELPEPESD